MLGLKEIINELKWVLESPKSRVVSDVNKERIYASAVDALEKQLPVGVRVKDIKYSGYESVNYLCGVCGWNIELGDIYCKHCGQKLTFKG